MSSQKPNPDWHPGFYEVLFSNLKMLAMNGWRGPDSEWNAVHVAAEALNMHHIAKLVDLVMNLTASLNKAEDKLNSKICCDCGETDGSKLDVEHAYADDGTPIVVFCCTSCGAENSIERLESCVPKLRSTINKLRAEISALEDQVWTLEEEIDRRKPQKKENSDT